MLTELVLTLEHRQEMEAHILRCLPEEGCGLAAGREGRVTKVFPITNALHSPVRFQMAPQEQLDVFLWLERHEMDLDVIFHSHPHGPPVPSETDIKEFAYPGSATMIWCPQNGQWDARAFLIEGRNVREIPIRWVDAVAPDEPSTDEHL